MNRDDAAEDLIEGTLERILYVNDRSGYTVALMRRPDGSQSPETVTIVGDLGGLEVGSGIRATGRVEKHPRFGPQFRVRDFEILKPAGTAALERYLAHEIKGVGPALARRITDHFGLGLEAVLDNEPERMSEVRGLGRAVVARIVAAWRDSSGLRELTVFLRGLGIAAAHARRVHKVYGRNSVETIRRDPYLLAREIRGIGFRTADAVAGRLGVPKNSIERARSAILYLLERMADEGHVYAPLEHIEGRFSSDLEMDRELAGEAVSELEKLGDLVAEEFDGSTSVYLARLHEAETGVARRLKMLAGGRPMGAETVDRALAAAAKRAEPALSTEQARALRTALRSKVTVITGGPGTGKTTLLRSLIVALADAGVRPALAAPTGRAARRLKEACGAEARTIHRLLEYSPETGGFIRSEAFPLRTSFLIVDEASMMDVELASSLLAALMPGCSLLLVGDRDQLPSVGPGSVLKDVISSGLAAVVELREVYRQARRSLIVANAHRLNQGLMPEVANDSAGDFFFLERNAPEEVLATIKQLLGDRLIGRFGLESPRQIQVLSPMNRGALGTHVLNRELQQLLNPGGRELKAGDRRFRERDRVIQLRNNYEKHVMNGEIGHVLSVDSGRGRMSVGFEDGRAEYDGSEMDQVGLGYAISVHKSQGSQYPAVVIPVHPTHYLMLRRNLLYTAITRAERVCVVVGTKKALQQAVRNQDERLRFSHLADRLRVD